MKRVNERTSAAIQKASQTYRLTCRIPLHSSSACAPLPAVVLQNEKTKPKMISLNAWNINIITAYRVEVDMLPGGFSVKIMTTSSKKDRLQCCKMNPSRVGVRESATMSQMKQCHPTNGKWLKPPVENLHAAIDDYLLVLEILGSYDGYDSTIASNNRRRKYLKLISCGHSAMHVS